MVWSLEDREHDSSVYGIKRPCRLHISRSLEDLEATKNKKNKKTWTRSLCLSGSHWRKSKTMTRGKFLDYIISMSWRLRSHKWVKKYHPRYQENIPKSLQIRKHQYIFLHTYTGIYQAKLKHLRRDLAKIPFFQRDKIIIMLFLICFILF